MINRHVFLPIVLAFSCIAFTVEAQDDFVQYVDPFIGTGGHGHTFPGATVPFGMVQLSPDTRLTGWDGCGGYHYTDTIVYGFSHTHLSGTGVSDYGDILLMPYSGRTVFNNGADGKAGYSSSFSKEQEIAEAGYYKTTLNKDNIQVELTATERTGLHRYTYPKDSPQNVIVDLVHRDMVTKAYIKKVHDQRIEGYRYSKAWAEDQRLHFVISFSKPMTNLMLEVNNQIAIGMEEAVSKSLRAALSFEESEEPLIVQVGISFVDIEGARQNLHAESSIRDFDSTKAQCQAKWDQALSKIKVTSEDDKKKRIFYSALYHTMIAPNSFTDVDGRYLGTDLEIHKAEPGHKQYTIFSLWDTYRATHPLYTIIEQKRTTDFINTFLNQYNQGGQLPMWELAANYTGCMIGYHAVPVISDAYIKGIRGFDAEAALQAMQASAKADKLGIPYYAEHGLLNVETEAECVSKTLEYAYDDWTIAVMADSMGNQDLAEEFYLRAQNYQNVMDPETKFMRARLNNRWFHPFDPSEVNYNYTEANSWQYSYYVPQDISYWKGLLGGDVALEQKLDALFKADSSSSGRHQVDITGLIGQYAHGNEPSHHIAYLYNACGRPDKTQYYVRKIMNELYSDQPDGYSGNEDCGQMSAWLVMSAMGFYPVTPGSTQYVIGSPWFEKVEIDLENGKTFSLTANRNSEENMYVDAVSIDGKSYAKNYLEHKDILSGSKVEMEMSSKPNSTLGRIGNFADFSQITSQRRVAVPAILEGKKAFFDETEIVIATLTPDAQIYYQLNAGQPIQYQGPFTISTNTELDVWAEKAEYLPSQKARSTFLKIEQDRSIELATKYANHYAAGGDNALIDYIKGSNDYRTGAWQGYEGVDLIATVDLGKKVKFDQVGIRFLQDENSWIFLPTEVTISISKNGKEFEELQTLFPTATPKDKGSIIEEYVVKKTSKARYIKVVGKNRGICPDYHKGAGGKSWIFADEIVID